MKRFLLCLALVIGSAGSVASGPFIDGIGGRDSSVPYVQPINIIDGTDDRDSLLTLGPALGLSPDEIDRVRKVTGFVGCLSPSPSLGTGTLFLTNRQILSVRHIFFERSGRQRSKCFFWNQHRQRVKIDLLLDAGNTRFGAMTQKYSANHDYAIVRLATPLTDGEPFPIEENIPVRSGDNLIVVTSHPTGMARHVDNEIPVVQGCKIRRAPISTSVTNFYRSDCDATGSSSGGIHLSRVEGRLVFRGITIFTGPWRDEQLFGAPYDEKAGSATTALGVDAAILDAGKDLAGNEP